MSETNLDVKDLSLLTSVSDKDRILVTKESTGHSAAALTIADLKSKVVTPTVASSYARGGYASYSVPSIGKGARWIRIAKFTHYVSGGTISINNSYNITAPQSLTFVFNTGYRTDSLPSITQIGGSGALFTKVRVVYPTATNPSATAPGYIEVYYNRAAHETSANTVYIRLSNSLNCTLLTSSTDGTTLPTGHTTYELATNIKGISTEGILAKGNITGNRFVSTIATGTAPLTVTSTTAVSNLNADMVDGIHASGLARGQYTSGATGATAGWYRIASSSVNINRCGEVFTIEATVSGAHSVTTLYAGCTYGIADGTVLNVLGHSSYGSHGITQARIVYHTTYSANYAYLEVYIPTAVARTVYVNATGVRGWTLLAPKTAGSIPSGYTSKTVTLYTRSISTDTFRGALSGNASTATTLQTARTINGTSFNGSANITTANWGTARAIGIVNSDGTGTAVTTSVNGSANINLKLPAAIKAKSLSVTNTTASTSSTTGALVVSGGVGVAGDVIAGGEVRAYSDIRLKSNIQPLDFRGKLTPRTYLKDGKSSIGFIAQEVKELYPELVMVSDTPEGMLSLNYGGLTAVLQAQMNRMDNEMALLKDIVKKQSEQINALEKRLSEKKR